MASMFRFRSSLTPLAAAILALAGTARAQDTSSTQTVQVTARGGADEAGVTGFAQPLSRTPIPADVVDAKSLLDIGALSLYAPPSRVRGFQVDNRYTCRRDGLPINAETVLPMDSLSGVEIMKGLSGAQAGT